jgi:hypothetical protein
MDDAIQAASSTKTTRRKKAAAPAYRHFQAETTAQRLSSGLTKKFASSLKSAKTKHRKNNTAKTTPQKQNT